MNKANSQGADILVSYYHNANAGVWGNWTGIETPGSSSGLKLARNIHSGILEGMGLRNRGFKTANFHMLRESRMPAT